MYLHGDERLVIKQREVAIDESIRNGNIYSAGFQTDCNICRSCGRDLDSLRSRIAINSRELEGTVLTLNNLVVALAKSSLRKELTRTRVQ